MESTRLLIKLCSISALHAYRLETSSWGANVQPDSGSAANFSAYSPLLKPDDSVIDLDVLLNPDGSLLGFSDFVKMLGKALEFRPKFIIFGATAYPRDWDFKKIRDMADKSGALMLFDMSHTSGLVAAQEAADPFKYCDVVTSTYKISWGPSPRIVFYRKGPKPPKEGQAEGAFYDFEDKINAVFPALEGGLHNHQIGVLDVALQKSISPSFKAYVKQVRANAVAIGNHLISKGYKLVTGGTDNHLVLLDASSLGLTGNMVEYFCDHVNIIVKKNVNSSPLAPGGVCIGSPTMTSRGLVEKDFKQIGEFLHRAMQITLSIQKQFKNLSKEFNKGLENDIEQLKLDVEQFSKSFDMPRISLV